MSNGSKRIVERWGQRQLRPISEAQFAQDMETAERSLWPVHTWAGEDRDGQPFTVVWVARPTSGALFSAYEITEGE